VYAKLGADKYNRMEEILKRYLKENRLAALTDEVLWNGHTNSIFLLCRILNIIFPKEK